MTLGFFTTFISRHALDCLVRQFPLKEYFLLDDNEDSLSSNVYLLHVNVAVESSNAIIVCAKR